MSSNGNESDSSISENISETKSPTTQNGGVSSQSKTENDDNESNSKRELLDVNSLDTEEPLSNINRKVDERLAHVSPVVYVNNKQKNESDTKTDDEDEDYLSNFSPTVSKQVIGGEPNPAGASLKVENSSGYRNRRFVRSRSWCASRIGDHAGVDFRLLRERLLRTQPHPQPSQIRNFTRSQKMTLMALALVDFISFCSMSIMAPFFPREAKEKGMSEATCGFVFSFYALMMFISSPIFGKITPVVGTKFLFISGIFIAGSCNLLFGVLEYIDNYEIFTTFCFLIRGFEALGASAYSTASYVYVVNTFPNNIGSVIGILETFIGLGMSIGPAIGGLLYSIGGFGLPFYVLGITMIITIPINLYLMPLSEDYSVESKSGSIFKLIKVPTIIVTGLIVMVISNTWAFLDPTLEPHLRQFNLSTEQVGLVFMLFSVLYGIFSPIWGWFSDRINNLWCMMTWGLLFCTFGLLLLGPSPLLPFLKPSLLLNIIGLSIIGISVALALLPTFQVVLSSSVEEGECGENISTYSLVAGVWSCMYSFGEFTGPSIGGILLKYYGFPICSTVMASYTFIMAIVTTLFFAFRSAPKSTSETVSDSNANSDLLASSNGNTASDGAANVNGEECDLEDDEYSPLLSNYNKNVTNERQHLSRQSYGGFDNSKNTYCNYKGDTLKKGHFTNFIESIHKANINKLQNLLVDSAALMENNSKTDEISTFNDHGDAVKIKMKKNGTGLSSQFMNNNFMTRNKNKEVDREFMLYSLNKIDYYNQMRKDSYEYNVDQNQVTDIKGTVNLTNRGACEV